jgi:hypothetical protein
MNVDALNRWLTLLSNLGVIAGFVLLAVQLNQNTRALQMQSFGEFSRDVAAMEASNMGDTPNASYAAAMDDPASLTSAQLFDVWAYMNGGLFASLHTWNALEAGYASEADWALARSLAAAYVESPVGRIIWERVKTQWPVDFAAQVDQELASPERRPMDHIWRALKNDIRALEGDASAPIARLER